MITFIKLYGPPLFEALKELEKIAVNMPEVCIMDTTFENLQSTARGTFIEPDEDFLFSYFTDIMDEPVSMERCNNIISNSGEKLGQYDFYFEWFKKPTMEELHQLIKQIDEALKPLGCQYSMVTKK